MQTVSTTELQNSFGKYLQSVMDGNEIIIVKNGKEVARLVSKEKTSSFLTDSLRGILKNDISDKQIIEKRILAHEGIDRY